MLIKNFKFLLDDANYSRLERLFRSNELNFNGTAYKKISDGVAAYVPEDDMQLSNSAGRDASMFMLPGGKTLLGRVHNKQDSSISDWEKSFKDSKGKTDEGFIQLLLDSSTIDAVPANALSQKENEIHSAYPSRVKLSKVLLSQDFYGGEDTTFRNFIDPYTLDAVRKMNDKLEGVYPRFNEKIENRAANEYVHTIRELSTSKFGYNFVAKYVDVMCEKYNLEPDEVKIKITTPIDEKTGKHYINYTCMFCNVSYLGGVTFPEFKRKIAESTISATTSIADAVFSTSLVFVDVLFDSNNNRLVCKEGEYNLKVLDKQFKERKADTYDASFHYNMQGNGALLPFTVVAKAGDYIRFTATPGSNFSEYADVLFGPISGGTSTSDQIPVYFKSKELSGHFKLSNIEEYFNNHTTVNIYCYDMGYITKKDTYKIEPGFFRADNIRIFTYAESDGIPGVNASGSKTYRFYFGKKKTGDYYEGNLEPIEAYPNHTYIFTIGPKSADTLLALFKNFKENDNAIGIGQEYKIFSVPPGINNIYEEEIPIPYIIRPGDDVTTTPKPTTTPAPSIDPTTPAPNEDEPTDIFLHGESLPDLCTEDIPNAIKIVLLYQPYGIADDKIRMLSNMEEDAIAKGKLLGINLPATDYCPLVLDGCMLTGSMDPIEEFQHFAQPGYSGMVNCEFSPFARSPHRMRAATLDDANSGYMIEPPSLFKNFYGVYYVGIENNNGNYYGQLVPGMYYSLSLKIYTRNSQLISTAHDSFQLISRSVQNTLELGKYFGNGHSFTLKDLNNANFPAAVYMPYSLVSSPLNPRESMLSSRTIFTNTDDSSDLDAPSPSECVAYYGVHKDKDTDLSERYIKSSAAPLFNTSVNYSLNYTNMYPSYSNYANPSTPPKPFLYTDDRTYSAAEYLTLDIPNLKIVDQNFPITIYITLPLTGVSNTPFLNN